MSKLNGDINTMIVIIVENTPARSRWTDDLRKISGGGWMRIAENRKIG